MKLIFDNVDELIDMICHRCPNDVHPNKIINKCDTDYDYDQVTCEKCWREYFELEVKKDD